MNPNIYFLRTERIGFRKWTEADSDLAYNLWGDYEVTKLIDARGQLSKKQVQERLLKEIATEKEYGVQYWPIFLLDNAEHLGVCGLRPYNLANNIYEIGFHLCSSAWGKGYATEAACAIINYAFLTLTVTALFAGHNPQNEISRHLLLKIGFQYTHDEFYEPTGLQHPSYIMSIEDYKA